MNYSVKKYITVLITVALYALLFVFSGEVKLQAENAVTLCTKIIVPSVFPMLTLSNTLLLYGFPNAFQKIIVIPAKHIFGLYDRSAVSVLFALTGGYPVGVKNARAMYEKNLISKSEAERLALVFVCPGLSFTLSVSGAFFGSAAAGATLFFSCTTAAVSLGFAMRLLYGTEKSSLTTVPELPFRQALITSTEKSFNSVLSICSYIILFASMSAILGEILPEKIAFAVNPLLEVTSGVQSAAQKGNIVFAAFLCGFGGFSVIIQLMSDIKALDISVVKFVAFRFITGVLSAVYELLTVSLLNLAFPTADIYRYELYTNSFSGSAMLISMTILLILSVMQTNGKSVRSD